MIHGLPALAVANWSVFLGLTKRKADSGDKSVFTNFGLVGQNKTNKQTKRKSESFLTKPIISSCRKGRLAVGRSEDRALLWKSVTFTLGLQLKLRICTHKTNVYILDLNLPFLKTQKYESIGQQ